MGRSLLLCIVAATILGGCVGQPLVKPPELAFQDKLASAAHWDTMAASVADKLVNGLGRIPDFRQTGHVLEATDGPGYMIQRPIYIRSLDSNMPFSRAFRDLLTNELLGRGYAVSRTPAGSVVVNYDVQFLAYNHSPPFGDGYVPGDNTVATSFGYLGWQAAENWDNSSLKAGLLGLGPALDILAVTRKALTDIPNAEVIITTSIVNEHRYLLRTADIFYVDEENAGLYAHRFNVRPTLMPTGEVVAVPAPPVRVRVVAN